MVSASQNQSSSLSRRSSTTGSDSSAQHSLLLQRALSPPGGAHDGPVSANARPGGLVASAPPSALTTRVGTWSPVDTERRSSVTLGILHLNEKSPADTATAVNTNSHEAELTAPAATDTGSRASSVGSVGAALAGAVRQVPSASSTTASKPRAASATTGPWFNESNYSETEWREVQNWGEVKETHVMNKHIDSKSGRKYINRYEIIHEIGRGVHGKVKLARDIRNDEFVAIKIIPRVTRRRLGRQDSSSQVNQVKREVAILKKCVHPHVVRLREVMDDPTSNKICLVLEYMVGGEIIWQTKQGEPVLTIEQIRSSFRDVILGLEYLHYQGIIHRDIKPANLLWTRHHSVKISDFGVSYISGDSGDGSKEADLELAKTAGTPAFFAPELCSTDFDEPAARITKAIDIWALGATLFCLLFGRIPWTGDTEFELFRKISHDDLIIPEREGVDESCRDLLRRLLDKNPETRITLPEIKRHPWVLMDLEDPETWLERTDPKLYGLVEVSMDDVRQAVSIVDRLRHNFRKLGSRMYRFTTSLSRSRSNSHVSERPRVSSEEHGGGYADDALAEEPEANSSEAYTTDKRDDEHDGDDEGGGDDEDAASDIRLVASRSSSLGSVPEKTSAKRVLGWQMARKSGIGAKRGVKKEALSEAQSPRVRPLRESSEFLRTAPELAERTEGMWGDEASSTASRPSTSHEKEVHDYLGMRPIQRSRVFSDLDRQTLDGSNSLFEELSPYNFMTSDESGVSDEELRHGTARPYHGPGMVTGEHQGRYGEDEDDEDDYARQQRPYEPEDEAWIREYVDHQAQLDREATKPAGAHANAPEAQSSPGEYPPGAQSASRDGPDVDKMRDIRIADGNGNDDNNNNDDDDDDYDNNDDDHNSDGDATTADSTEDDDAGFFINTGSASQTKQQQQQ